MPSKENSKRTVILGATTNTSRYAYLAAERLTGSGHEIVPVGIKKGQVFGQEIINDKNPIPDIDTITLYVSERYQAEWYDFILDTKPERIIFNPGTENFELRNKAHELGIETEYACTLVMLAASTY